MKKILFSTILALAATGTMTLTTSCEDQLDIEQKGVIPTESFYKTDADAESALVAAYESFMCNVMDVTTMVVAHIYTPLKLIVNECGDDVLAEVPTAGDNTFGILSISSIMMLRLKGAKVYVHRPLSSVYMPVTLYSITLPMLLPL